MGTMNTQLAVVGEPVIPAWTQGDRMRKARAVTGLTTREFARELGVSQQTVVNAENDHVAVRRTTLSGWSLATGVPREWLETGEWAPRDSNPQPTDYVCDVVVGPWGAEA